MSFLLPLAAVAGEAGAETAAVGAGEAAAGAEATAGAGAAEEGSAGRLQNFQQGCQQGQGASKGITGGEIMGALHQRVESNME